MYFYFDGALDELDNLLSSQNLLKIIVVTWDWNFVDIDVDEHIIYKEYDMMMDVENHERLILGLYPHNHIHRKNCLILLYMNIVLQYFELIQKCIEHARHLCFHGHAYGPVILKNDY